MFSLGFFGKVQYHVNFFIYLSMHPAHFGFVKIWGRHISASQEMSLNFLYSSISFPISYCWLLSPPSSPTLRINGRHCQYADLKEIHPQVKKVFLIIFLAHAFLLHHEHMKRRNYNLRSRLPYPLHADARCLFKSDWRDFWRSVNFIQHAKYKRKTTNSRKWL